MYNTYSNLTTILDLLHRIHRSRMYAKIAEAEKEALEEVLTALVTAEMVEDEVKFKKTLQNYNEFFQEIVNIISNADSYKNINSKEELIEFLTDILTNYLEVALSFLRNKS